MAKELGAVATSIKQSDQQRTGNSLRSKMEFRFHLPLLKQIYTSACCVDGQL